VNERVKQCRIIDIPRFTDLRGTLAVIDGKPLLPFEPKRFFYIYGVPEGAHRGCHALRTGEELIIAMAGSFKIDVEDGDSAMEFQLDRPHSGLLVPSLIWHDLHSFTDNAVCAVLASTPYDRDGYFRVYEEFLVAARANIRL
jgi:dTDP-4-dehydrorhamnose 3,5-epimerase-like enzyme